MKTFTHNPNRRRWRKLFRKGEKGQATIDTAFGFVTLLLTFPAVVQVILYAVGLNAVSNAARHGARAGSVVQSCAACAAISEAQSAADRSILNEVNVSVKAPGGVTGSRLTIVVTAKVPNIVPGSSFITGIDKILTVEAQATFRQEGW